MSYKRNGEKRLKTSNIFYLVVLFLLFFSCQNREKNSVKFAEFSNNKPDTKKSEETLLKLSIAANPETPEEILSKLVEDDIDGDVRYEVAKNFSTSSNILIKLAQDIHEGVRSAAARNNNMPKEWLIKLSDDKGIFVRGSVAQNPNTPLEILIKLADDKDPFVRHCVGRYGNLPYEVFLKLSQDKDEDVKYGVAKGKYTPVDILAKLGSDNTPRIRNTSTWAALRNIRFPLNLLIEYAKEDSTAKEALAGRLDVPPDVLMELAKDENVYIIRKILKNPKLPIEAIIKLSDNKYKDIIEKIRDNPKTPKEIVEKIKARIAAGDYVLKDNL